MTDVEIRSVKDIQLPSLDFGHDDLLQCKISLNTSFLHSLVQNLIRSLQKGLDQVDRTDQHLQELSVLMDRMREDIDSRIADVSTVMQGRVDGLRREVLRELDELRSQRDDRNHKMANELENLKDNLAKTHNDLNGKIDRVSEEARNGLAHLQGDMDNRFEQSNDEYLKLKDSLQSQITTTNRNLKDTNTLLNNCQADVDDVYTLFDIDKKIIPNVLPSGDTRVNYIHTLPAVASIIDANKKESEKTKQKFDNVHRRLGSVEQQLTKKVEQTELEELKDIIEANDHSKDITRIDKSIKDLFERTDYTDKALSVGLERKADKVRVDGLEEDIETLESRVKEALEAVGVNRFQQLVERLADLDHYMQKMDRRKVGRSEFQRMAKRLRQQVMGDTMERSGDVHVVPGSGVGSPMAVGTDGGKVGIGSMYDVSGDLMGDAAFIRYRCLSCNKPSAKLIDEGMAKPPKNFPPSTILTTNPSTTINSAARARTETPPGQVTSAVSIRQDRKMENYFKWVESQSRQLEDTFTNTAMSGSNTVGPTNTTGSPRSASPSTLSASKTNDDGTLPAVPRSGSAASTRTPSPETVKQKKIRTSLVGTDNKLYQGLQDVHLSAAARNKMLTAAEHMQHVSDLQQAAQQSQTSSQQGDTVTDQLAHLLH